MNTPNNIRTRRTEEMIRQSMMMLLQKHHLREISISLLCQQAQINRSTFYAHYDSIFEVLADIAAEIDGKLCGMVQSIDTNRTLESRFSLFADQVKEYADFFRVWLGQSDAMPKMDFLTEQIIHPLTNALPHEEYQAEYYEQGVWAMIRLWLNDGMKLSTQEITNIFLEQSRSIQLGTIYGK